MVDFLLRASLRHRVIVLAVAAMATGLGLFELGEMPVDVLPDVSAPRVVIVTEATGLAPVEIEQLITFPIETAVNGAAGTRTIRSASAPGISIVFVDFDWDTDDVIARQRVTERLQSVAGTLPEEASAPLLAPPSSVMGEIAQGLPFAEAASKYSTCPSAKSGGSLGSFEPGKMVREFDEVCFDPDVPVGEVTGPVRTQFGYHLILVEDRFQNMDRTEGSGVF